MAAFRAGRMSVTVSVLSQTYLLMAVTGLGYLALTWSTVVLLGGFVTSLQRTDFWCITVISMLQAARIFNDLGERLVPKFLSLVIGAQSSIFDLGKEWLTSQTINKNLRPANIKLPCGLRLVVAVFYGVVLFLPLITASYIVVFLYGYAGPFACIGLATWRMVRRDYGSSDGNLAPALNMFYSLILCQGALYLTWLCFDLWVGDFLVFLRQKYRIPRKWGYKPLLKYHFVSRAKCWRDPGSIQNWSISRYAVDLIDSASWDDNRWGTIMLAKFIKQGADVSSLLVPSRTRIQKLIDTLGWRERASREMRESAACIVAHLAGDIHLSQFPGAIRCISSLLQDETTWTYLWNCSQQDDDDDDDDDVPWSITEGLIPLFEKLQKPRDRDDDVQQKHEDDEAGGGCNELILQGLTILERLALDHQNCVDICTSPGILPKITTPLYSATLIQDIKASGPWVDVVNGTFSVLHKLICAPDETCRRLRRDISTNERSVTNLKGILNLGDEAERRKLQIRAMEILTELASDSSINLTREVKESLIKKLLQIFLADEGGESSAATCNQLKATAGRTLAFLSANGEMNSATVNDSFDLLTEMLDAKNIKYRIIAAEILENLCAHCNLDRERVKETLLPKVLRGILSNKREPPQSHKKTQKQSAPGDDEENQRIPLAGNDTEERNNISTQGDNIDIQGIPAADQNMSSVDQGEEEQTAPKPLQGALLSLILVIYEKVICADDFDEVQKKGPGFGAFVAVLKTLVEENREATIVSLRIVKLCGQIAKSMMRRNQYTEEFRNQGFVELLSEAKEIMSNLESCVLFAETDPVFKKVDRPLLSQLEAELEALKKGLKKEELVGSN